MEQMLFDSLGSVSMVIMVLLGFGLVFMILNIIFGPRTPGPGVIRGIQPTHAPSTPPPPPPTPSNITQLAEEDFKRRCHQAREATLFNVAVSIYYRKREKYPKADTAKQAGTSFEEAEIFCRAAEAHFGHKFEAF